MKISFKNDYSEGCHPNILDALAKTNLNQHDGYGLDQHSNLAKELILKKLNSPKSAIHFVSGGTQANLLVIGSCLRPHESVISAESGHIAEHEAGAIEATGHKVNVIHTETGKLTPEHIKAVLDGHVVVPHQVKPKLVYISNSTELGTIYTKADLHTLSDFCKEHALYLYMDGARLGQALMSEENDLTLEDIAQLTDVFYIGGTKNGALLGEAIVINTPELQDGFEFIMKQNGALLSKGRLLGIQFQELFTDDLFFDLALGANKNAMKIKDVFKQKGCSFLVETSTNQLFPILSNHHIEKLSEDFEFYVWEKVDETSSAIRIITSWATREEDVSLFIDAIKRLT